MIRCRECGTLINPRCTCGSYNVRESDDLHEYYCNDCKFTFHWEWED